MHGPGVYGPRTRRLCHISAKAPSHRNGSPAEVMIQAKQAFTYSEPEKKVPGWWWLGGWLGGWGQFPISESTETTEASAKTPKLSIWTHKKVGGSLQNARKVSLQNARSGSLQNAIKKRKRITMVFDTSSIYCTCFSVSDGCSGCSVDVTGLDRAHMSHATGELSVNVHACSKARTCNGF